MSERVTFEILPGLPGTGPMPLTFPESAHPGYSEGLVVRFPVVDGHSWVGNFGKGLSRFDDVEEHPDGDHVLVIAGGQGYVVDPVRRRQIGEVGGAIVGVLRIKQPRMLILNHQGVAFEAIDRHGTRWHTRRLSWDGFQALQISEVVLRGEAWNVLGDYWELFTVNLETGNSTGGAYRQPDSASKERLFLAPPRNDS